MIRILIVEDQKIMQKYFEYLIESNKEFQHVQTIADANDAIKVCNSTKADLVLMDVQTFHNHDGLSAGKIIREKWGRTFRISSTKSRSWRRSLTASPTTATPPRSASRRTSARRPCSAAMNTRRPS